MTSRRDHGEPTRLALEAARMHAWSWDVVSDRTTWSEGVAELFGITLDDFDGSLSAFLAAVHTDDREAVAAKIREVLDGGGDVLDLEHRVAPRGGAARWVAGRAEVIRDAQGRPCRVHGVVWDTTARRAAEANAIRMQRLYSVVAAINQQIVRVRDADALLRAACRIAVEQGEFRFAWVGLVDGEGHVAAHSHAGHEDGYLAESAVLAMSAGSFVGPTSRALVTGAPVVSDDIGEDPQMAAWRELALRRGYRSSAAFPFRRGGRVVGTLNVYAEQVRFFDAENVALLTTLADDLGTALDQIDLQEKREQAEAALRMSEDRYRSLVLQAADGILLVDGTRVVDANPAVCELLGYSRDELLASTEVAAALGITSLAQGATVTFERAAPHRDGSPVDVEIRSRGLENGHVQAILRDLGPRKRMLASLVQHERLLALGRLARGVAHEINNPLAYVALNLEAAETHVRGRDPEAALPRAVADALAEAREGAERVRRIVRDLSAFGRGEEDQVGPVDVHHVLDAALHLAESATRGRARVVRRYGPDGGALANEHRLGQVFLNLVLNAVAAIPEGDPDRNEIRITTSVEHGSLVILVADTGSGIEPAVIERIFDPFFTTKPVGEGSGLGLAIAHGIVTGLGGSISVTSRLGGGATFRVAVPRGTGAEANVPVEAAPARPVGRLRVLVVDDEEGMRRVLHHGLSEHEITLAASGREAIALCDEHEFDRIVCDVTMANGDGVDVYEHLRAEGKGRENSIVFMTGGAFSERVEEFLARVENACLEKPFEFAALLDAVAGGARR